MNSYFDTSALLPALLTAHPNHQKCLKIFSQAYQKGKITFLSMHGYAELYANITRFPLGERVAPAIAVKTILELGKIVKTIDLNHKDYQAALRRCAERELTSGIIYDALHLQAAVKAKVDILYTANLKDFERLYSPDLGFELAGV